MTDAREIIAHHLCEMAAQGWSGISPFERAAYRTTAQGMVGAIEAAGFRILGPDDVDQVTVDRCAEVAERMLRFADTTSEADIVISEAIRAIGRKA